MSSFELQQGYLETDTFRCVRSKLREFLQTTSIEHVLNIQKDLKNVPFYSSIDIRDAGFKLAPIDANLFPAGFNNICDDDLRNGADILAKALFRRCGKIPRRIAILPEAHTKNRYYLDNLLALKKLFTELQIEVEIGWWPSDQNVYKPNSEVIQLESSIGMKVNAYPLWIENAKLKFSPFEPEFIVLNNDFSGAYPKELENITQPIEPSFRMGWHTRKKSSFFTHYNQFAERLALAAGIDPWRLQVNTNLISNVDFSKGEGMEAIALAVDEMIDKTAQAYTERSIAEKPFVFVKNNSGTYGMAVLKVESGQELLRLNRREKNKMSVGKNGLEVREVIIQEGIPTRVMAQGTYGQISAEPVVYLMEQNLLGAFLRTNPERGREDNLNSRGMVFKKLCVSDLRRATDRDCELELVYGVIGRLSIAALTLEIADTLKAV